MASTFKSSVTVKTAGSPAKAISASNTQPGGEVLFATIYGIANKITKRANPKDPSEFYEGLAGTFEVLPGEWSEDREAIGGPALYAPDAIHDMVAARLNEGAKAVSFAFEAWVVVGGTAGFTWKYRFANEAGPEEEDILASVRQLIKPTTKALPKPKTKE